MYDTVPEYSINVADPFWPLLLVPAAAVALSFLSADLAQRIASSRGYLKSGYVLGLLLGPLGVLIALGLPTRPQPLLHCLYDWYRRCDEYSGARWFIGQTLALALWVYLGLLALQAHVLPRLFWPSWLDPPFNISRDWLVHLLITLGSALLIWRTLASRARLPLYMLRISPRSAEGLPPELAALFELRWHLCHWRRVCQLLALLGSIAVGFDLWAWLVFAISFDKYTSDTPQAKLVMRIVAPALLLLALLAFAVRHLLLRRLGEAIADARHLLVAEALSAGGQDSHDGYADEDEDESYIFDAADYETESPYWQDRARRMRRPGAQPGQPQPDPAQQLSESMSALLEQRLIDSRIFDAGEPLPPSIGNLLVSGLMALLGLLVLLVIIGGRLYQFLDGLKLLRQGYETTRAMRPADPAIVPLLAAGLLALIALAVCLRWLILLLRQRSRQR